MTTQYVDLYAPTRDNPYWHTVTRTTEDGWGHTSAPLYDHRNGHYDGRCTLTQADALDIVRRQFPNATIVVRGEATYATNYRNPELARIVVAHVDAQGRVDIAGGMRNVPLDAVEAMYPQATIIWRH